MDPIDCVLPEIMVRIFKLLSPQDLKAAVLVSKNWKEMVDDPSIWTWVVINIDTEEDIQKVSLRRLQTTKEVKVGNGCVEHGWGQGVSGVTKLLKSVDQIISVRKMPGLNMCKGISAVKPNLVVRVINRLEVLWLGGSGICLAPGQLSVSRFPSTGQFLQTSHASLIVTQCIVIIRQSPITTC